MSETLINKYIVEEDFRALFPELEKAINYHFELHKKVTSSATCPNCTKNKYKRSSKKLWSSIEGTPSLLKRFNTYTNSEIKSPNTVTPLVEEFSEEYVSKKHLIATNFKKLPINKGKFRYLCTKREIQDIVGNVSNLGAETVKALQDGESVTKLRNQLDLVYDQIWSDEVMLKTLGQAYRSIDPHTLYGGGPAIKVFEEESLKLLEPLVNDLLPTLKNPTVSITKNTNTYIATITHY